MQKYFDDSRWEILTGQFFEFITTFKNTTGKKKN